MQRSSNAADELRPLKASMMSTVQRVLSGSIAPLRNSHSRVPQCRTWRVLYSVGWRLDVHDTAACSPPLHGRSSDVRCTITSMTEICPAFGSRRSCLRDIASAILDVTLLANRRSGPFWASGLQPVYRSVVVSLELVRRPVLSDLALALSLVRNG